MTEISFHFPFTYYSTTLVFGLLPLTLGESLNYPCFFKSPPLPLNFIFPHFTDTIQLSFPFHCYNFLYITVLLSRGLSTPVIYSDHYEHERQSQITLLYQMFIVARISSNIFNVYKHIGLSLKITISCKIQVKTLFMSNVAL